MPGIALPSPSGWCRGRINQAPRTRPEYWNLRRSLSGRGLQLGEGSDIVHKVPGVLCLDTLSLALHFSFAVPDDVEQFPICLRYQAGGIAEIGQFGLHVLGQVASTSPIVSMAKGALVTVDFLGPSQGFRRSFHRVGLVDGFQRDFGRGRSGTCGWRPLRRLRGNATEYQGSQNQERLQHGAPLR